MRLIAAARGVLPQNEPYGPPRATVNALPVHVCLP